MPARPASVAQRAMWLVLPPAGGPPAYHVPWAVWLRGPICERALAAAWTALQRRHAALRGTFAERDGELWVEVAPDPLDELAVHRADPGAAVEQATAFVARPFDLPRGPLARAGLWRTGPGEALLAVGVHHLVCDGATLGVFAADLAALLVGEPLGAPAQPPDDGGTAVDAGYWRDALAGFPPVWEFPFDYARPPVVTFAGGLLRRELGPADLDRLDRLARELRVSLFCAVLTAYSSLLLHTADADEIVVGVPVGARPPGADRAAGLFANTLPLPLRWGPEMTWAERASDAHRRLAGLLTRSGEPLSEVVRAVNPPRGRAANPLFQTTCVLHHGAPVPRFPGVEARPCPLDIGVSLFDLSLRAIRSAGALELQLEYSTDLFAAESAGRLADRLALFLRRLAAAPDAPLSRLLAASPDDQRALLRWRCDPADCAPGDTPAPDLVAARARHSPDRVAVRDAHGAWTFSELLARAGDWTAALAELPPGSAVGVAVPPGREFVAAVLGLWRAGLVYVPLPAAYPPAWLHSAAERAAVRAVLQGAGPATVSVPGVPVIGPPGGGRRLLSERAIDPDGLAYVLFTSGSTGAPRPVGVRHRSLGNHAAWMQRAFALGETDHGLLRSPLGFDTSLAELLAPLVSGATLVVLDPGEGNDPAAVTAAVRRERVTLLQGTPSFLAVLAEHPGLEGCRSLRHVLAGGEVLASELAAALRARTGAIVHNTFGPTEGCIDALAGAAEVGPRAPAVPLGRPAAGARVAVLDRWGELAAPGCVGELVLSGPGVAAGYLAPEPGEAARFVPDPVRPSEGAPAFRTGDRVRWLADGRVEFHGRRDRQVKVAGVRIELDAVEAALLADPAVRRAAVVVEAGRLVAHVVLAPTPDPAGAVRQVRHRLAARFPRFGLPAALVTHDALPVTPGGKLGRAALARSAPAVEAPAPAPLADPTERAVAEVWGELLPAPEGRDADFFDAGGHSLLAARFVARLAKRFGREVRLDDFLGAPTVAGAAALVGAARTDTDTTLHRLRTGGTGPPVFCVHPLGGTTLCYRDLAARLAPGDVFGLQSAGWDEPPARIEDWAAGHRRSVERVHGSGPLLVVGWSLGGVLGWELCRQWRELGRGDTVLALLDARFPRPGVVDGARVGATVARLLSVFPPGAGADDPGAVARLAGLPEEAVRKLTAFVGAGLVAAGRYAVPPLGGTVLAVEADEPGSAESVELWKRAATGTFAARRVAADHYALLRPPAVDALAEFLSPWFAAPGGAH